MKIEDLTKEQVEEWSDDEVMFWAEVFARQERAEQIRNKLLGMIEINKASRQAHTIKIDSKVIN